MYKLYNLYILYNLILSDTCYCNIVQPVYKFECTICNRISEIYCTDSVSNLYTMSLHLVHFLFTLLALTICTNCTNLVQICTPYKILIVFFFLLRFHLDNLPGNVFHTKSMKDSPSRMAIQTRGKYRKVLY